MVAVRPNDADRVAANPPPSARLFLVYGPDTGLVSERVKAIVAASADPADPFAVTRLDGAAVAADAARLADEAYAVPMFGGRRAIVLRDAGGRSAIAPALAPLLKSPPADTVVVVQAGDLKKSSALRTAFERDPNALAIGCYLDDAAALGRLVDHSVRAAKLTIAPEARAALLALLGGDRLASRGEIEKLCLYAQGAGRIERADVEALAGDAGVTALDEIVDAAATGDLVMLSTGLDRLRAEGATGSTLGGAALRHFQSLDAARAMMEAGSGAAEVVERMRPPVFYKRKPAMVRALEAWDAPRLSRALGALGEAIRASRLNADLGLDIVGATLFALARSVKRR